MSSVRRTSVKQDEKWMQMAVEEAQKCVSEEGRVSPMVGCVVVRDGEFVEKGYRGEIEPGEHAEFTVLDKKMKGARTDGLTVYTTLEPCTHRSPEKTPCATRLVDARVKRVVIGMVDPDRRITGQGIEDLRRAGIEVALFPDAPAKAVEAQNREFVRLKRRESEGWKEKSELEKEVRAFIKENAPEGEARSVDYEDCFNYEPINWLYPQKDERDEWLEQTWALELFFKGPGGQRGGPMFAAVKEDPEATKRLDQIALLTLRKVLLERLLLEYPGMVFSVNVTAVTLKDHRWFDVFAEDFREKLLDRDATNRVVFEIQEHPKAILRASGVDGDSFSRRLEVLRSFSLPMALDDTYSEDYVFQTAVDSLEGQIVWQKMDWDYFQTKAHDARSTLCSGIRGALDRGVPLLVIEGVETKAWKSFLWKEMLRGGEYVERVAIQSRRTRLHSEPVLVEEAISEGERACTEAVMRGLTVLLESDEQLRSLLTKAIDGPIASALLAEELIERGLIAVWQRISGDQAATRQHGESVRQVLLSLALCAVKDGPHIDDIRRAVFDDGPCCVELDTRHGLIAELVLKAALEGDVELSLSYDNGEPAVSPLRAVSLLESGMDDARRQEDALDALARRFAGVTDGPREGLRDRIRARIEADRYSGIHWFLISRKEAAVDLPGLLQFLLPVREDPIPERAVTVLNEEVLFQIIARIFQMTDRQP
jgi:pyrimidine deaminase RibD-like protein